MVVDTQVRKLTEEWWIEERMASLEERLASKGSSVAALLQCTEKEVRQIMDSIGVPFSEPYMPALKQIKKAVDQEAKRDAPPQRWVPVPRAVWPVDAAVHLRRWQNMGYIHACRSTCERYATIFSCVSCFCAHL